MVSSVFVIRCLDGLSPKQHSLGTEPSTRRINGLTSALDTVPFQVVLEHFSLSTFIRQLSNVLTFLYLSFSVAGYFYIRALSFVGGEGLFPCTIDVEKIN